MVIARKIDNWGDTHFPHEHLRIHAQKNAKSWTRGGHKEEGQEERWSTGTAGLSKKN